MFSAWSVLFGPVSVRARRLFVKAFYRVLASIKCSVLVMLRNLRVFGCVGISILCCFVLYYIHT